MKCVKKINQALHDVFEADERVQLLGEDILDPYGGAFKVSKGLSDKYPDRVYGTPISEAAIVGIANGMALKGLYPVVEIMFGDFITLTFDQVVNYLIKFKGMYNDQVDPHVVIRTPMGGYRGYGPTHSQSLEKFFLGIPNLSIYSLSHLGPIDELIKNAILKMRGPVLLVENKMLYGYDNHTGDNGMILDFTAGISWSNNISYTTTLVLDPEAPIDFTLITYGGVTPIVMDAVKGAYMDEELNGEILVLSCLSELDMESLECSVKKSGNLFVVEEGTKDASFGDYVISSLAIKGVQHFKNQPVSITSDTGIIPSSKDGEFNFLPSSEKIKEKIISHLT